MMKKLLIICLPIIISYSIFADQFQYVTIGTGSVTGIYYPTGGAIAKLVNQQQTKYKLRVTVEPTVGAMHNIKQIMNGNYHFALAQSDLIYRVYNGAGQWEKENKHEQLRSIFALYPEVLTLVVTDQSNIQSCADLKGKKLVIGMDDSGTQRNTKDALSTCNLKETDLAEAVRAKSLEAINLLREGEVDGYFYTVGHPNGATSETLAGHKVRFIPFSNTDSLIKQYPYYENTNIPVNLYTNALNKENVPTFGVKAMLVTLSTTSEETVYNITKEVFENLDKFKKSHPAYNSIQVETMLTDLNIPLHKGAIKYYKEAGLSEVI